MNFHKALILFLTLYLSFPAIANEDFDRGYAASQEKDYQTAITWYRKAAEQGYARAQVSLGVMYDIGLGVKKDYVQAVAWYRKAAEQGYAAAQYNLGVMYDHGLGVKKDYVQAVTWYRKAAEQGYANAQYSLAFMYDNGQGVKNDYVQAFTWRRKAAEQGHANAQYNLGLMYEFGKGIEKDLQKALSFYKKANTKRSNKRYLALYATLHPIDQCLKNAKTKIFNTALKCTDRDSLMAAVKNAGAQVNKEDKNNWGDTYFTSDLLKGSSELAIDYTVDDFFAK